MKINLTTAMLIIIMLATNSLLANQTGQISGMVFLDKNRNLQLDRNEKGISGVLVSNQVEVTTTNRRGNFQLPVRPGSICFITKPAGYEVPLNATNQPLFYRFVDYQVSPDRLTYKGIQKESKVPETIRFPLWKSANPGNRFKMIVAGDPQTASKQEIDFFRDAFIPAMIKENADLYLDLGDIMFDDLSLYPHYNQVTSLLDMPSYHVFGNHDVNFLATSNQHKAETFRRYYGPDYYSFDQGAVHFVVLNSVDYHGWNKDMNQSGGYTGGFGKQQMRWLKNDLSLVDKNKLIVLAMHIPMLPKDFNVPELKEAFAFLQEFPRLMAWYGHHHIIEIGDYSDSLHWNGDQRFPYLVLGATSGSWWSEPLNEHGIPVSLCRDGSPKGYFVFSFDGTDYSFRFSPSKYDVQEPMRITWEPSSETITANIFSGTNRTKVHLEIEDILEMELHQSPGVSPLFSSYHEKNRDHLYEWIKPVHTPHIWKARLPASLPAGQYKVLITARDEFGHVYKGYHVIEKAKAEASE